MNVAGNFSRRRSAATVHLERTDFAVELGRAIAKLFAFVHLPSGVQHLAVRGDYQNAAAADPSESRCVR